MYLYTTARWTQQRCLTWKMWLFINHSITRTYSVRRCIDRQFVNGTKNEINTEASIFTVHRYSNNFNTLIPTLSQSKSFKFGVPKSHAPESIVELMISPKKMICNMLAPIPVTHERNWYINSLCLFFPFAQWILWRTVLINRLYSHSFYCLNREASKTFQFITRFFSLPLAPNFMFNLPGSRNVSSQCTDTIWCKVRNKVPSIFCFTFPLLCCICRLVTDS